MILCAAPALFPADAQQAYQRAQEVGVCMMPVGTAPPDLGTHWVLDALLGLGYRASQRPLSEVLQRGLKLLREHTGPILAVDVPSGLNVDSGAVMDWTPRATATLALLTLKPGLFTGQGRDACGDIWWDDLDVPQSVPPTARLSCQASPPARLHTQHKGSFGDVTLIGGAAGMTGAILLAAQAAHFAGAGRVYVSVLESPEAQKPSSVGQACAGTHPALMFRPWTHDSNAAWSQHTLVVGCGGGLEVEQALPLAMSTAARLIIDADGLNALARSPSLRSALQARAQRGAPTILTPHPLEAARLLGCNAAEIQAQRLEAAQRLADELACVVVLKGSGTVLAAPAKTPWLNLPGNASLASPGTGDVLAGWMGGWWAQQRDADPLIIARDAVAWHGLAVEPGWNGPMPAAELIQRMYLKMQSPALS